MRFSATYKTDLTYHFVSYVAAFTISISRSISQCESHGDAALVPTSSSSSTAVTVSGTSQSSLSATISSSAKDVTDVGSGSGSGAIALPPLATSPITVITTTANQATSASSAGPHMLQFKERTMSITSVTEEDDEPVSLLSERCRYISVSEEDENAIAEMVTDTMVTSTTTATTTTSTLSMSLTSSASGAAAVPATNLQTTVITEQPTASKLELDLMLASADINPIVTDTSYTTTTTQEVHEPHELLMTNTLTTSISKSSSVMPEEEEVGGSSSSIGEGVINVTPQILVAPALTQSQQSNATAAIFIPPTSTEMIDKSSPSIPTSIGTTTSEDSDEYRSLEPKDDADFPISE